MGESNRWNNYAISTADLAQSLTKSSGSLVAANGTLQEAVALTATANALIQDADVVGTALKTVAMRLRGTSVEEMEEEGIDTDGAVTSKSKLQSKVKGLSGVDILTDTGAYKSTYQILSEIADVWESMNDMDQAALLELLAGKRAGSVMSAILQNPETLKDAFESANDAAGSALKENEKYLDSIQGRIDLFNNALQTMWSSTLNDDVVKDIVNLGTELIKVIDKIGLLNSILLAFGAYKGLGMMFNTFKDAGISIDFITKKLGSYLFGINTVAAAENTLTQAQVAQKLTRQGLTAEQAQAIAAQTGLATSTANLSRETLIASLQAQGYSAAEAEVIATQIFGTTVTNASTGALIRETIQRRLANSTLVQFAIQMGVATAAEVANMTITGLLTTAVKGLAAAFKALWTAIGPIGWIILGIIAVVTVAVTIFNYFHKTTEELTEDLEKLKTELQDIQSEFDALNSELETTNERISELLAKDKLSFTEKEELDNLKKLNNELQRRVDLLEAQEKSKREDASKAFVALMKDDLQLQQDEYATYGYRTDFMRFFEGLLDGAPESDQLTEFEYIDYELDQYERLLREEEELEQQIISAGEDTSLVNQLTNQKNQKQQQREKIKTHLDDKTSQWFEQTEDLIYYTGDDLTDWQKENNQWLDYVYNTQDRWSIVSGGKNAKSNTLNRIFDKDENKLIKASIDEYVEALKNGDVSAKTSIENIIENNENLVKDIRASGLDINDAVGYFTSFASELEFATLEGKIKEVSSAAKSFESLLKGGLFKVDGVDTGLTDLFNEEGKIIQTKLSQVFRDTSDQTRAEITRLLEGSYDMIADGLDDAEINYLMNRMGLSFSRAILEIEKTNLATKNLELFPGLEDEISGIIDTFSELTSAVGGVVDAMDTLDKARAEEAHSGSMSLETLEALMQSTDNYADLIKVDETGAIHLATNAQEILVAQKLEAIKQNAALALEEAELAYQEALHTEQTYSQTGPAQDFMRGLWNEVGGAMAFVGSLWNDLTNGNWDGAWDRANTARESSITTKETEYSAKAAEASAAVAEAAKNVENAEKMNKIAQGLTPENVKERYSSEEASGGADDPEEVAKNALDEKMEEFQREMDYWENRIGANQARYEQLQNEIDLLESKGQHADASYYEEQIKLENERKNLLLGQKQAAEDYLEMLEYAGQEGSEEWWEVANTLNDIEGELDDVTASIVDLQDAIGEIDTYKFEEFNTRISNLTDQLETIRNLLADEDEWFNSEGEWTEDGVAALGTYIQQLEVYKNAVSETGEITKELAKYQAAYAGNEAYYETLGIHSEQEYYDKFTKIQDQHSEYLEMIDDTEDAVIDMYESQIDAIEEYTESLIDGYNDYIDVVKEALDAERDLYDFKKNVQKQAKDIAEIERRIMSLSGSTNAADIAERRRLEAELYGAREELDNTYYDHAKEAQNEALDAEQTAYEESMTKFVEGLRTSLEEATLNMDEFLMGVTSMVMYNADTILAKYEETNLPLTTELTNPWIKAKEAVGTYSGNALDLMNQWTQEGGFFAQFNATGTKNLQSPWNAGTTAANNFKTDVGLVMSGVVSNISTNVKTASGELSKLYQQIVATEKRAQSAEVIPPTDTPAQAPTTTPTSAKKQGYIATAVLKMGSKTFSVIGDPRPTQESAKTSANVALMGEYAKYQKSKGIPESSYEMSWLKSWQKQVQYIVAPRTYAKGTIGTKDDEWAITDEPQFGDELTMYATPEGTLSFMRAGSTVVPADITKNLVEWGQLSPDAMNIGSGVNVNMINNAVNKPEFNLSFEALVKAERIDENTLPEVKRYVQQEINSLVKQMNYAIKGRGGR